MKIKGTIKFHNAHPSNFNVPQDVVLTVNGEKEILQIFPTTRYWDSQEKVYTSFKSWSKINGKIYI